MDLLYGELSPEEEAQLRRELEEDDELAEEFHELKSVRREVAEQIPEPREVPQPVRDSILKKARRNDGDRRSSTREEGASRRARGVWRRLGGSGQARAVVGVALMMVVAGGVYYALFGIGVPAGDVTDDRGVEPETTAEAPDDQQEMLAEEAEPEPVDAEESPAAQQDAERIARQVAEQRRDEGERIVAQLDQTDEEPLDQADDVAGAGRIAAGGAAGDSDTGDLGALAEADTSADESVPMESSEPDTSRSGASEGAGPRPGDDDSDIVAFGEAQTESPDDTEEIEQVEPDAPRAQASEDAETHRDEDSDFGAFAEAETESPDDSEEVEQVEPDAPRARASESAEPRRDREGAVRDTVEPQPEAEAMEEGDQAMGGDAFAEAEVSEPEEDAGEEAESLLEQAREAHEEGDRHGARRRLHELFRHEGFEQLDAEQRQEARQLRSDVHRTDDSQDDDSEETGSQDVDGAATE